MSLYELFIGFRYLKSKKSQGIVSSNTFLSIVIVFLGVFILIVVLSVMNGFQAAIKDKILDVDSHIPVQSMYGPADGLGIRNYDGLVKKISLDRRRAQRRALHNVPGPDPVRLQHIAGNGHAAWGATALSRMMSPSSL